MKLTNRVFAAHFDMFHHLSYHIHKRVMMEKGENE